MQPPILRELHCNLIRPSILHGVGGLNLSFHMHDEAIAATSTPGDTAGRYLPYESADLYGGLQWRLRVKPTVII